MKAFLKLFDDQLDRHLDLQNPVLLLAPNHYEKLLRELRATNGKRLIKVMNTSTANPFKLIRLFNIVNLVLIFSKEWIQVVEKELKYQPSRDQWINSKFLEPYYRFLIKCCSSKDRYNESKSSSFKKSDTLQMLFYTINMLRQLFKVVQKMPLIGRYYKQKNQSVVASAINMIALQAQKLYNTFKFALGQILLHSKYFIKSKEDERIVRGILVEDLSFINQEMKKLFLDKYFYPLGNGIHVRLFRPQQQSVQCEKTFNSIVSNHEQTQRQKRKEELECTLFPGSGLVNWNFYQETLLAGPNLNVSAPVKMYVDLDDLAISEEDQRVEEIPSPQTNGKKEEQSQKETNTGTLQVKGHQM